MTELEMFLLTSKQRGVLHSVLNEILNGFEVVDVKNTIGMNESELREFFDRLH